MKFFCFFFLAITVEGFSQGSRLQTNFVAQQWNIEHGLPQSTVRCITQTHDGYLWIGTWNGLARFDGVALKVFRSANVPALLSSNIMSLFTDSRGQLWIGTDPGGLVRYADDLFTRFDSTDGFSATRILSINEDRSGNIWFATEIGAFAFDGKKFLHFTEVNGLPSTYANQVYPFADGKMYLGFVNTGSVASLKVDSIVVEKTFSVGGYTVAIDSQGTIWFGVRGKGFIQRIGGSENIDKSFAEVNPGETYILRNGDKWLLTPNGVSIISDRGKSFLTEIDRIKFESITTVFEDREGNIWLGKEGGGVILLRKKQVVLFTKENGLYSNEIMTGLEDRSGRMWIGTWNGGLQILPKISQSAFLDSPLSKKGLGVYTLCESHNGTIWAGIWGAGLYSINGNNALQFARGIVQPFTSIVAVAEDTDGGLWVGTAHDGVAFFKGSEEKIWDKKTGLSGNRVNSILCARNGDIWITVSAHGVNRISDSALTVYKKGSGLNDDFASPLYQDKEGNIWVGTNNGLNRWKNGAWTYVTEKQGLFDNAIAQIIEDDLGNFWIGAIHGIFRVSRQELNDAADGKIPSIRCFTIGKEDGMLNEETGGGGTNRCWKTTDGRLWFATASGVVVIDPKTVASNPVPPNVIIEEVWVENKPVLLNSEIVINPGETKIELQYTGIHFTAPKKIRFKYFLDGFDKEWNDAGVRRLVQYTNLDPGNYQFRVRAENNAGAQTLHDATVGIIVLPPFHATWWFRAIIVIFFLTIGPVMYIVRVHQLEREKEKQVEFSRRLIASQESERKRIATELHDGLGQHLLIIKNKLLVILQSLNKEISTTAQVEEASDVVSSTIDEVRSISHNLRPHQLDQLGITKTLRSIVRQVNESTAIEFSSEIDDIDGALSPEEEISLFRIVQESLNNIIKHSSAATASVGVKRNPENILLTISDDGKGISSPAGFGISGMRERAKMFGWTLSIESDHGATISITIPLVRR